MSHLLDFLMKELSFVSFVEMVGVLFECWAFQGT